MWWVILWMRLLPLFRASTNLSFNVFSLDVLLRGDAGWSLCIISVLITCAQQQTHKHPNMPCNSSMEILKALGRRMQQSLAPFVLATLAATLARSGESPRYSTILWTNLQISILELACMELARYIYSASYNRKRKVSTLAWSWLWCCKRARLGTGDCNSSSPHSWNPTTHEGRRITARNSNDAATCTKWPVHAGAPAVFMSPMIPMDNILEIKYSSTDCLSVWVLQLLDASRPTAGISRSSCIMSSSSCCCRDQQLQITLKLLELLLTCFASDETPQTADQVTVLQLLVYVDWSSKLQNCLAQQWNWWPYIYKIWKEI
jgi:hypothetical protein